MPAANDKHREGLSANSFSASTWERSHRHAGSPLL